MTVSLPPRRRSVNIDVSLAIVNIVLLLIFFFLATGQITAAPERDGPQLPLSTELPLEQLPRPVLIVGRDGQWMLDEQPIAPDLLGVALDALPQPVILNLFLDRSAPAGALVEVLRHPDLAERSVRLVTLKQRVPQ